MKKLLSHELRSFKTTFPPLQNIIWQWADMAEALEEDAQQVWSLMCPHEHIGVGCPREVCDPNTRTVHRKSNCWLIVGEANGKLMALADIENASSSDEGG